MRYGAEEICLYEFVALDGGALAPFSAGSHVDVHLPIGIRQYSLANDPSETDRYVLGVKRDRSSRGGSRYMHESLRVGAMLEFSTPRNNFQLNELASHTVLIAGGIGITPIRSMIQRLNAIGKSWELHYAVRVRREAVFAREWQGDPRIHLHVDEDAGGRTMDLGTLAERLNGDTHAYCCGPAPMISSFEQCFEAWPAARRHVEHFNATPVAPSAPADTFSVVLSRSQVTLTIPPDRSILSMVREAGFEVEASCEQGICGACETRILSGEADHRDMLLSAEDRLIGRSMMICCSRSKSAELVLDL